jgi:peptidoglycan L-alanyl-D-glutamate endopeptidase CwlK
MPALSDKSRERLIGVHDHLGRVVERAAEELPFELRVTSGLRTVEEQKRMVAIGASRTMRSRHLTGHAVDVAPVVDGKVRWDWPLFNIIAAHMKQAARELETPIVWGGDWRMFRDGPHFELNRRFYPATEPKE